MSENGIFLYFWTKKVIFKHPPRLHMTKTNYKRKNGIFLYFEMEKKIGATYDQAIYKFKN